MPRRAGSPGTPRSGIAGDQPRHTGRVAAEGYEASHPIRFWDLDGTGIYHHWRRGGAHPTGQPYPAVPIDKNLSVSATVLLNRLPMPYTLPDLPIKINGLVSFIQRFGYSQFVGVIASFAHGPIGGFAEVRINGQRWQDCSFLRNFGTKNGTINQTPYQALLDSPFMQGENFDEGYPGIASAFFLIYTGDDDAPKTLQIDADLYGREIYDYRTAVTAVSANPALVIYDIMTTPEIGIGIDSSRILTGAGSGFEYYADHCDDIMGDGSARYAYSGVLPIESKAAIAEVGPHAFLRVTSDGKLYDLAGWDCPGVPVGAVRILRDHQQGPASWREIPRHRQPQLIRANYKIGTAGQSGSYPAAEPGINEGTVPTESLSLPGSRARTYAARIAEKKRLLYKYENREFTVTVLREIGDQLRDGDIALLDTHDGESALPIRIVSIYPTRDGWYRANCINYSDFTDSVITVDEDGTINSGAGPNPPPPNVTNFTEEIVRIGPWIENDLANGGNNITAWTESNMDSIYDGTEGATLLNVTAGFTAGYTEIPLPIPVAAESLKITLSTLTWVNPDILNTTVKVQLLDSLNNVLWSRRADPTDDRYIRSVWEPRFAQLSSPVYKIRIAMEHLTSYTLGNEPTIAVKEIYIVPAGSGIADTDNYTLRQNFAWTLPVDPLGEVSGFRVTRRLPIGREVIAELGSGETTWEYQTLPEQQIVISGSSVPEELVSEGQDPVIISAFLFLLQVLGVGEARADFPAPIQSFVVDMNPPEELAITAHVYTLSDLLEEPIYGRQVDQWNLSPTVTVTPNIDTAPDGTLTADKLQVTSGVSGSAFDAEQWPLVAMNGEYMRRTVWMKKSSTTDYVDLIDADAPSGTYYHHYSVRPYFRFYQAVAFTKPSGGYPQFGGPTVTLRALNDEVIVWSAGYQPIDSSSYTFELKLEWEYPTAPWLIGHLKFQYRMADVVSSPTPVIYDWQDHGPDIPYVNLSVTIGQSSSIDVQWFPLEDPSLSAYARLHDWRLVAVGINGDITEVSDPADVSVIVLPRDAAILKSTDLDQTTSEPNALLGRDDDGFLVTHYPQSDYVHTFGDEEIDGIKTINDAIVLADDATISWKYYKDVKRTALDITSNPAQSPTLDTLVGDIQVWWYSENLINSAFFTVDLPTGYKEGAGIQPYITFVAEDGSAVEEGVRWRLEYSWRNVGGIYTTSVIDNITVSEVYVAKKSYRAAFAAISGVGMDCESSMVCRIARQANSALDTYGGRVAPLWLEFRVEIEAPGSKTT